MTLPPLPAPHATSFYANPLFTDDQMRAYGEVCAAAERERCARVAEQQAECNGLAAGWHIAAEIRGPNQQLSGAVGVRLSARLGLVADAQGLTTHKPTATRWAL